MNDADQNQIVPADQATGLSAETAQLIPFAHHQDYLKLPVAERERVKELLEVMASVKADERGVIKALKMVALANKNRRGWSFHNLRTLFYNWLDADWRVLSRDYGHDSALPAAFVTHLRTLALKEHRSRKQAINKLREAWREGKDVPGYGTWRQWFAATWPDRDVPKHFCGDYPRGWGNSNLYENMPSRVQHTLATKGRAAISGMMPKLQRDPSELRFLELITIDDFETDVLAIHGREVVRVRGFLAIDVATRTRLAVGFKPRVTGDEGQKISVTAQDMQFLLKSIFARWRVPLGYPVTFLVENATASISAELEAALDLHFGGQVRVERTGMLNYKTLANGFVERGGKPQEKGWIESYFNALWNRAGALPGQKGNRYDNEPGDLDARKKYVKQLAAYETTDEQWAQFRLPFLSFDDLVVAFEEVFDWMDNRTQHKMLGFERITEWRRGPGDEPKPLATLATVPRAEQMRIEILPPRMQSPAERRAVLRAAHQFVKVPEPVLALLAFTARTVTVKNHHVTFTLRGEGYTFAEGGTEALKGRNGEEVIAYFDEGSMAHVYCFTREGAYLGAVKRWGQVSIKDPEAISAAAAQLAEFYQREIEQPVRALLAGERAEAEGDRTHNEAQLVQWRLKAPADGPRKPALAKTLAADTFTAGAEERFAVASQAAASIGGSVQDQADDKRRRTATRKPKHGLDDITGPAGDAAAEPDLDKLI